MKKLALFALSLGTLAQAKMSEITVDQGLLEITTLLQLTPERNVAVFEGRDNAYGSCEMIADLSVNSAGQKAVSVIIKHYPDNKTLEYKLAAGLTTFVARRNFMGELTYQSNLKESNTVENLQFDIIRKDGQMMASITRRNKTYSCKNLNRLL